jgi:hypothetical protein
VDVELAVARSRCRSAFRLVEPYRIIVQDDASLLTVLIQRRDGERWLSETEQGSVRYLAGMLKNSRGIYCGDGQGIASLARLADVLPTQYRHLLAATSEDWEPLYPCRRPQEDRCSSPA